MALLRRAYDTSMPKKTMLPAIKATPWWRDEIAGPQSRCLHRRRVLTRVSRRADSLGLRNRIVLRKQGSLSPNPMKDTERMEHIVDTLFPTYSV
ncbi:hypothetical protein J6590_010703 [Homalodisca vitripennis]|nr:hypothetical protein J6590_010703 [Homalodisca vitripennis]